MKRKRTNRWHPPKTWECWCPPWYVDYGWRWPWCWLPTRAHRWMHTHLVNNACEPRWLVERDGLVDKQGRWLFRTREEYAAYLGRPLPPKRRKENDVSKTLRNIALVGVFVVGPLAALVWNIEVGLVIVLAFAGLGLVNSLRRS